MGAFNAFLSILENCWEADKQDFLQLGNYLIKGDEYNAEVKTLGSTREAEYIRVQDAYWSKLEELLGAKKSLEAMNKTGGEV